MVQPITASPSCIQSYSPCSLINDLIQRVADCVAAIFNAIAGLFSSCFGAQAPSPVLPPVASPALPIPRPSYNPLQMIAPNRDLDELDEDAYRAAVEDGSRFLLDQLQDLQRTDRAYYETLITKLEVSGNIRFNFAQFFVCYLLSLPAFDQPNDEILDFRARFAALSEEERAVVLVHLKATTYWSPNCTPHTLEFLGFVNILVSSYAYTDVFSECTIAAQRALIAAGDLIDPDPLVAEGSEFLIHEWKHTDTRYHERLLGRFGEEACNSLCRTIVYHLVFPATITAPSDTGRRFLDRLMQTHAARTVQGKIERMRATFDAFSKKERTNALEGWRNGRLPIASTQAFNTALWELKDHFDEISILEQSALRARDQLRSEGAL